jgi:hypothetical protein
MQLQEENRVEVVAGRVSAGKAVTAGQPDNYNSDGCRGLSSFRNTGQVLVVGDQLLKNGVSTVVCGM